MEKSEIKGFIAKRCAKASEKDLYIKDTPENIVIPKNKIIF